ncbi:hypothetical protein ABPG72_012506 [Tetrahymena utriculariae]
MSYTRMDLIVATTKQTQRLIFQQSQTNETVYDYQRVDTYFSQNGIEQRMQISGYAYLVYELNQIHNYIQIEEPMITEILAQFISIFNKLLLIGFLAKLVADSHIIDDMNNMLFTEYYKKTAFMLIQSQEVEDSQQKSHTKRYKIKNLDEKIEQNNSNLIINNSLDAQKCKFILECQIKINQTNFSEQLSKYIKLGFFDRIINLVSQIFGRAHKVQSKDDANQDKIFFRNLMKQSLKRINLFEVYKDLIKMKMAIKLILTKEQYAAIQFCGTEILLEEQQKSQICQNNNNNIFSIKEKNVQQIDQQSKQKPSFQIKILLYLLIAVKSSVALKDIESSQVELKITKNYKVFNQLNLKMSLKIQVIMLSFDMRIKKIQKLRTTLIKILQKSKKTKRYKGKLYISKLILIKTLIQAIILVEIKLLPIQLKINQSKMMKEIMLKDWRQLTDKSGRCITIRTQQNQ